MATGLHLAGDFPKRQHSEHGSNGVFLLPLTPLVFFLHLSPGSSRGAAVQRQQGGQKNREQLNSPWDEPCLAASPLPPVKALWGEGVICWKISKKSFTGHTLLRKKKKKQTNQPKLTKTTTTNTPPYTHKTKMPPNRTPQKHNQNQLF